MCKTISGIALLTGDTIVVRTHPDGLENHSDIREYHNIRDDNSPIANRQTPIEYNPGSTLDSCSDWELVFDDERPDWWTDDMTEEAERQLWRIYRSRWDGSTYNGNLNLRGCTGLTSLPENMTCGNLNLCDCTGLTSLPENMTCENLDLWGCTGLTSLPENM